MQKATDWSLFGGHKKFRENPAVSPGRENKLRLEFIYDKLDNPIFPLQGFYLEGAVEKGGGFLGGDFNQTGVFLTAKYFQSSFANQKLVFQERFGRRDMDLFAPQYLLDLGGIGTLRGYRFKEFADHNNLFLSSVQYYFNGDLLQKLPLQRLPFYSGLGLILFAEVGSVWGENILLDGVVDTGSRLWKSDAGFSLSMTGDFLRIDFAKRLDRSSDTWTVTFRILPHW